MSRILFSNIKIWQFCLNEQWKGEVAVPSPEVSKLWWPESPPRCQELFSSQCSGQKQCVRVNMSQREHDVNHRHLLFERGPKHNNIIEISIENLEKNNAVGQIHLSLFLECVLSLFFKCREVKKESVTMTVQKHKKKDQWNLNITLNTGIYTNTRKLTCFFFYPPLFLFFGSYCKICFIV